MIGLSLWVSLAGCDRSYSQCYGVADEVSASVEVIDGVPVFDWEIGTAYALSVYEEDTDDPYGHLMWHVQCGGDNLEDDHTFESNMCIEAPLAYGEVVRSPYIDHVNDRKPKPLVSGVTYRFEMATLTEHEGPPPEPTDPSPLQPLVDWLPEREYRDDPHCGALHVAEVLFEAP